MSVSAHWLGACFIAAILTAGGLAEQAPTSPHADVELTGENATVVDTELGLAINGCSEVQQQIFGLTAYEGVNRLYTPEGAKLLQAWGVASLGLGGGFGWVLPRGVERMDAAPIEKGFADPGGAARLFFHYPRSDRYVYGKALANIRPTGVWTDANASARVVGRIGWG